jgi:hypothetical protein
MSKKPKEVNIFNYLNQIFYKSSKLEYDKKIAPAYMLSMWLSHDSNLIGIVDKINHLQFLLKDDIIYKYYMSKVPKGKRFIKWTKKTLGDKRIDKRTKELMVEGLSKREAQMTANIKERIGL